MSAPARPIRGLPEHPYTDEIVQRAAENTPLAGKESFTPEYTEDDADIIVSEPSEFARADRHNVVYIADGERIDVTGLDPFDLSNTVVAGGRHKPNTEPGMVVDTEGGPGSVSYRGIFQAENGPGHVHGIRLRGASWYPERAGEYEMVAPSDARCWPGYHHIPGGPDDEEVTNTRKERDKLRDAVFGRGISLWHSGSTVRNCDIHGFIHAGVSVGARTRVPTNVEITQNQIHNCCTSGLGYPINVYNGEVLSKWNYFNAYRHSITGFGYPTCAYTSRYDVFGPDALLSPIDMHQLGENVTGGGAVAGKYVHVDHSTILASHRFETPGWYSKKTQPAIGIRGYAEDGIYVSNNQFMQDSQSAAMMHINVSDKFRDWHFNSNQYGKENWTIDSGVGIDFASVPPIQSLDDTSRDARRAKARALSQHLKRLSANV